MTVLEHTLSWKHLAPTTPDTLSCFPYTSHDPFILDDHPQIYFAANQTSLQHKIIEGICKCQYVYVANVWSCSLPYAHGHELASYRYQLVVFSSNLIIYFIC